MIIKELNDYYERLLENPGIEVASAGWCAIGVTWEVTIDDGGRLISIMPLHANGEKPREMIVPEHFVRSGTAVKPFFLCENAKYFFGLDEKRGREMLFRTADLHKTVLDGCEDVAAQAVVRFFEATHDDDPIVAEFAGDMLKSGGWIVFRLSGDRRPIHERPLIRQAWDDYYARSRTNAVVGQCSITGEVTAIERLFPQVTGVPGANSAGASLVSFNCEAFTSYGKEQAYNSPISSTVAFNAGSALGYLYRSSRNHIRVGDMTILFWTDRPAPIELAAFGFMLEARTEDNEENLAIKERLLSIKTGRRVPEFDYETKFFILGLSPNAARLSVRLFEVSSFGTIYDHYQQYRHDLAMIGVKTPSMYALACQAGPSDKSVPCALLHSLFDAMLKGSAFPQSLYQLVLSRMRCDHGEKHAWDLGQRAAIMKAHIVRKQRLHHEEEGLTMALNECNDNTGYLLGRLFAVVEHAQYGALGAVNAGVADRYIGAASLTPSRVFPSLIREAQPHIAKLRKERPGLAVKCDKELEAIVSRLDAVMPFPSSLSLDDQGQFFVGYYQERQGLWKKKDRDDISESETDE